MMSGLGLMLWGMGTVFSFLILLVFTLLGVSRLAPLLDADEVEQESLQTNVGVPRTNATGADLVAAITAAVTRFRATHR